MGRKKRGAGEGGDEGAPDLAAFAAAAEADAANPLGNALGALNTASMLRAFADPVVAAQVSSNPLLSQLWRHVTAASTSTAAPGVHVDVQELADHFGLDERITKRLDDEMKNRPDSFEGDIAALYDILETARSPAGLLSVKIKEMQDGTFIGLPKMDPDIKDFKKKYELDDQAVRRLAEAKAIRKVTWHTDVELLHRHLETSNKPSARIMMMLGKLRSCEPLGDPETRIAPGSYLDRMQRQAEREKAERRDRDRDRRRSRSRDRDRDRDGRDRDGRDRHDGRDRDHRDRMPPGRDRRESRR